MATRKKMDHKYLRRKTKQRKLEMGFNNRSSDVHETSRYESINSTACQFNASSFVVIEGRSFDRIEIAQITKQNVWWNYADINDMLKLYALSMGNSGKSLNSFSNLKLVEFIEENAPLTRKTINKLQDDYQIVIYQYESKLTYDSHRNVVVCGTVFVIEPNENYEDITHVAKVKRKKGDNALVQKLISVVNSRVFNISHVYNNNMDKMCNVDEFVDMVCESGNYEFVNGQELYGEELEKYNKIVSIFDKGMKAMKSKAYKKRAEEYDVYFNMDLKKLIDWTLSLISENPLLSKFTNEYSEFIKFERYHNVLSKVDYSNCLPIFSLCMLIDDYSSSFDIYSFYRMTVEAEMQQMGQEHLSFDVDLLSENWIRYFNHIQNFKQFV